jgi:hypothetical protein
MNVRAFEGKASIQSLVDAENEIRRSEIVIPFDTSVRKLDRAREKSLGLSLVGGTSRKHGIRNGAQFIFR